MGVTRSCLDLIRGAKVSIMGKTNPLKRLLLTGLGQDQPGIVNTLSESIANIGASIEESRMLILGGEFAIILLVAGDDNVIATLEQKTAEIGDKVGLSIQTRRTERKKTAASVLRYKIEVISMDQTGIVHSVTDFFANRKINIESLSTDTYAAAHSGTQMFSIDMVVEIPTKTTISGLRHEFLEFCDDLFVDASIEAL